ncbi:MAG: alpha/beta fold hydrolase [Methyloceanibacter sp.]|uniref:alpha/beta fold hydrolase n=1 Tax=Methyloceanibacter sp. TaxID=1965321 RepID=UPI003EDFE74F
MARVLVAAVVVLTMAAALAVNAMLVGLQTRPAMARSGGVLMETDIVTANVKVEGEGPPIVLIHGFGAALDWWDAIAPQLARNHRVIRLDLIGHGGTEAPGSGYGIERQASLVKAVLDKLGVTRAVIVGHSMGGEVVTAFTVANPQSVERLVLIDSPPKPETDFDLKTRLALSPLIGQGLWRLRNDTVLRQALSQGFVPGFPGPEKFIADLWQLTYPVFHQAHDDSVAYVTEEGSPARLSALDPVPPLLVIFGTQDALISPDSAKLFETVPGAKLVMIDGAGHSPMVEKPAETLAQIEGFID